MFEVAVGDRVREAELGDGHHPQRRGDQQPGGGIAQSEAPVERGGIDRAEQISHHPGDTGGDTTDQQSPRLAEPGQPFPRRCSGNVVASNHPAIVSNGGVSTPGFSTSES